MAKTILCGLLPYIHLSFSTGLKIHIKAMNIKPIVPNDSTIKDQSRSILLSISHSIIIVTKKFHFTKSFKAHGLVVCLQLGLILVH